MSTVSQLVDKRNYTSRDNNQSQRQIEESRHEHDCSGWRDRNRHRAHAGHEARNCRYPVSDIDRASEPLQLEPLDAVQLDRARGFVNIRFWGAFMAVKYGSAHIRPGGSVTLTNGVAGLRPRKGWALVASICGAMEAFTRALALELAPIRVNAVCPGVVRTELWNDMTEADRDALYRDVAQSLPVGRVGEPEDIAQAYLYLMREGYSTGQVIVVDGGAVLV
jgi:NAD(P)-dependent dehydrogenase (short-subunit alcohol dehydrogenase family)